jgi:hypothetical protein
MKNFAFENLKLVIKESVCDVLLQESSSPLYTGFVFDEKSSKILKTKSQEMLLNESLPNWIISKIGDHGIEQLNHHVTITTKQLKPSNPLRERLEETHHIRVIGIGVDPELGISAWRVELPQGFESPSGIPHSTAALRDKNIKPFLAKEIKNWELIDRPFLLTGVFQEVRGL